MVSKVFAILGSVRFWILTLLSVVRVLNHDDVVTVIEQWLGAVVALGTLDSVATKFGK